MATSQRQAYGSRYKGHYCGCGNFLRRQDCPPEFILGSSGCTRASWTTRPESCPTRQAVIYDRGRNSTCIPKRYALMNIIGRVKALPGIYLSKLERRSISSLVTPPALVNVLRLASCATGRISSIRAAEPPFARPATTTPRSVSPCMSIRSVGYSIAFRTVSTL